MSRNHVHSQGRVTNDLQRLSEEQLLELYGIEIYDDGMVYDPAEDKWFDDLIEWAKYIDDLENEENYGSFSKIGGKQGFDDDNY